MFWIIVLAMMVIVALLSAAGLWFVVPRLRQAALLDRPNARSSHDAPVPIGAGIALVPVILLAVGLTALGHGGAAHWAVLLLAAAGLAILSFIDDSRGLPVPVRLAAQFVAVAAVLASLPAETRVLGETVPLWLERAAAGLLWLWFVNLYNFMDGIDGIAGVESLALGIGIVLIAGLAPLDPALAALGAAVAGAALAFLRWNWSPAKVFLGDVGSIPLGFLIGFALLEIAAAGWWAAALAMPAYYLADASITLARRLAGGRKVWQAHRSHFYQRAAVALGAHAPIARMVLVLNVPLVAAAVYNVTCEDTDWKALGIAAAATAAMLWQFQRIANGKVDVG